MLKYFDAERGRQCTFGGVGGTARRRRGLKEVVRHEKVCNGTIQLLRQWPSRGPSSWQARPGEAKWADMGGHDAAPLSYSKTNDSQNVAFILHPLHFLAFYVSVQSFVRSGARVLVTIQN